MKKMKACASSPSTGWRLPNEITYLILERLPLSDYVRFAAVCRNCQSIEREHRHLHAPHPPPMLPLPWVFPSATIKKQHQDSLVCDSPFEGDGRSYRFTLPAALTDLGHDWDVSASSHGWLILINQKKNSRLISSGGRRVVLLNPLSGAHIQLPELNLNSLSAHSMSSNPDDPSCTLLIASGDSPRIFLWRATEPLRWINLPIRLDDPISAAVFADGKFYCTCRGDSNSIFVVVHLLPQLAVHIVADMNCAQLPLQHPYLACHKFQILVECEGKILMVVGNSFGKLLVFRADLSEFAWEAVEWDDNSVLLLINQQAPSFSVSNSYIQAALRARFPYFIPDFTSWRRFELSGAKRNTPLYADEAATATAKARADIMCLKPWKKSHLLFLPVLNPSP